MLIILIIMITRTYDRNERIIKTLGSNGSVGAALVEGPPGGCGAVPGAVGAASAGGDAASAGGDRWTTGTGDPADLVAGA